MENLEKTKRDFGKTFKKAEELSPDRKFPIVVRETVTDLFAHRRWKAFELLPVN